MIQVSDGGFIQSRDTPFEEKLSTVALVDHLRVASSHEVSLKSLKEHHLV